MWSLLLIKHVWYMLLFKSCRLRWWPIPSQNGGPISLIKSTHDPSSNAVWTSNSLVCGYICLTNYSNSHYHQHDTSQIVCSVGLWPKALISVSAKREYFVKNNEHIFLIDCTEFLVWCQCRDLVHATSLFCWSSEKSLRVWPQDKIIKGHLRSFK